MKNLVVALLLVIGGFAQAADLCKRDSSVSPDDWRPWPWGQEIQIPWRNLPGIWETSGGECENLFLFKVKTDQNGEKIVQIIQYDPMTCMTMAQGLGYESGRYIYAQMVRQGQSYNLTIHAFNGGSLMTESRTNLDKGSLRSTEPSGKFVLALTLSPVGQWDDKSAFEIDKISNSAGLLCKGM